MTIEQVKEEAKKRFDRELTDEQAQEWLNAHTTGELQDNELDDVAGGGCGGSTSECPKCGSHDVTARNSSEVVNTAPTVFPHKLVKCNSCGHTWSVY